MYVKRSFHTQPVRGLIVIILGNPHPILLRWALLVVSPVTDEKQRPETTRLGPNSKAVSFHPSTLPSLPTLPCALS